MSKSEIKDHYWIKSGFFSLLQNFSTVIFGFGSFYILVRVLPGKSDFGAWALFMTTTSVLENIRNGLVQNALIRYLSLSPVEEHNKIIGASFANSGLLTGACIILNLACAHYISVSWQSPQLEKMFYLYSFVYLISGIVTQFQFIMQAHLQFNGIFITTFIRQGIFFAYVFICSVFSMHIFLINLVYVQIASVIVSMIIGLFFVKKYLQFSVGIQRGWMKKLFDYGKYAFGTSVSSTIFSSIDQMMLGSYLSAAAAGIYNIAVRITNLVEIPTGAIAAIVFPQSAKRVGNEGPSAVKYLYEKSVGTLVAILLPGLLFLLFFPALSIHFIAGNKYIDAVPILKVTVFYCLFVPYGRQFGVLLDSMGRPRLTFLIVFISAVINIGLNYFLIHRFGVIGAAYATLSANIIGFIISQIILRKELKVNLLNTFKYAVDFYPELYHKLKLFLIKTQSD